MRKLWHLVLLAGAILVSTAVPAQSTLIRQELGMVIHPDILAKLPAKFHNTFVEELVRRAGIEGNVRQEKDGTFVVALAAPATGEVARDLPGKMARLPGVLATRWAKATEERRAAAQKALFVNDHASLNVIGFIIKYRSAEKTQLANSNEALSSEELARLSSIAGLQFIRSRAMSGGSFVVYLKDAIDQTAAARAQVVLESDPAIKHVSINEMVEAEAIPNDPYFSQQWSLAATAAGINAVQAWNITTGASTTVVAVIDTGILPHPDLASRLLPGYDFISNRFYADDGDGYDNDPTDNGDWAPAGYCRPGSPYEASSWHGLHVAGIVGAQANNGYGIAGVDWRAKILPVRVLGACGGEVADIVDGMRWAAGISVPGVPLNPNPARVINMSLGGRTPCWRNPAEQEAAVEILAKGAALVVSAGNRSDDAANYSPAGCYGVITVAATGPNGDRASYSNYSDDVVTLSAPGGDDRLYGPAGGIWSTLASGKESDVGDPIFQSYSGTSMAAPHVAGTIALMIAANPELTIAQIRDIIRGTARSFGTSSSCARFGGCGWGLLDAASAVETARGFRGFQWNFTDHWYLDVESGWGIQVTAQGALQFVTWYTYDAGGYPLWFTMQLTRVGQDIFVGDVYKTTGVPMHLISGGQATKTIQRVGEGILTFFGYYEGWLLYDVQGYFTARPIGRLSFASPATFCEYSTQSRASATNYQDMWWNPSESGWGLNITHQGDVLFATWFTYNANGQPLWLYLVARKEGANRYSGRLTQTMGVPFDRINFGPALLESSDVGWATLTFTSGETARFEYNAYGYAGTKTIQRQVFASPTTHCQAMN